MVRILVISSCTKSKTFTITNPPSCKEISSKEDRKKWLQKLPEYSCAAKDLYKGTQHLNILQGINIMRHMATDIDFYILSAAFGLLGEYEQVPVYTCSFNEMNKEAIRKRAEMLSVPQDFKKIVNSTNYDLIYLALGKKYLEALGDWYKELNCLTIAFCSTKHAKVVSLKADNKMVSTLSFLGLTIHGVVGLKGDLLRIIAQDIKKNLHPKQKLANILASRENLITYFQKELFILQQEPATIFHL